MTTDVICDFYVFFYQCLVDEIFELRQDKILVINK